MRVLRISHSAVVDAWRERERALGELGVDVELLSAERWDEGGTMVPLEPRPDEHVSGVTTFGSHPALFVYDPRPLWRALGRAWDVIDIHEEPFALATAEVLAIRALRGAKAPFSLYSAQNIRKRYPVPFRWIEKWSLRRAAAINVCNSEAGRICQDKGFPGEPTLIPLGIDRSQFRTVTAPRGEGIVVGYAGRLAAHKGVTVLLEAVAGDERLTLHLAGAGPQESELRDGVQQLGIGARVSFRGSLGQDELPAFYQSLDVLAVPSLETPTWVEQFGRVAVEAMACGVPVVASDSGALPDVVGGAGLLVPPDNSDALREALIRVGTDAQLADELRAHGLERAAACDWKAVAQQTLTMYRTMLQAPLAEPVETPEEPTLATIPGVPTKEASRRVAPMSRPLEVVLVAYGSPDLVRQALEPVRSLPVTVVDNSSLPEIAAICAELGCRYLDPGRNGGFAAGVNHALANRQVPSGDVLLLNPDAVITAEDVHRLQAALLADANLASVGPAQVDADGTPAQVSWPFPSPWGTWVEALGLGKLRGQTGFVIGSVLLLRAEALAQVGGFDERFFLYAEETDWAYRATLMGWRHAAVDTVTALHLGAATSSDPTRRETHFHGSQERYQRKHFGSFGWHVARAGQLTGALARSLVLSGERGSEARRRAALYRQGPARAERQYQVSTT